LSQDPFDACVIGPVARDVNAIGGREQPPQPGGAAWYSSMVYAALGLAVAVVTRVAAADEPALLGGLRRHGIAVFNLGARVSTTFRNIYDPANPDLRRQRVDAVAPPIRVRDLPALDARIWQVGPLTGADVSAGVIARCIATGGLVGLDVQGLTRRIAGGAVGPARPARRPTHLRRLNVLKADEEELLIHTGAGELAAAVDKVRHAGVREVLVTQASRGSTIYGPDGAIAIDPLPPRRNVDPTGCGDTYLAAYLAARLASDDLRACGMFAAAAATLKMESAGPLDAGRSEILARLQEAAPAAGPG
jgi:sugar/nucleoside kinase (ribokinase family)